MDDPNTTLEEAQASVAEKALAIAESTKDERLEQLTEEERALLEHSVLFPETFDGKVTILGEERRLRALPIKYAKQIHAALSSLTEAAAMSADRILERSFGKQKRAEQDQEFDMLKTVMVVSHILAEFYQWDDVLTALKEEMVTIEELQALIVMQQGVQRSSDFLLTGLRVITALMQTIEMAHVSMRAGMSPTASV